MRQLILLFFLLVCSQRSEEQGVLYSYEGALRSAVKLTSHIKPDTSRDLAEMRAFSSYLSPPFLGYGTSPVYAGCQDAYTKGAQESGVYPISHGGVSFRAWCDFDSTGGWMVIHRRVDGVVDFFKRWTDYEHGFGNLWGEHWLGLNKMHLMTINPVALFVYMEAFDGTSASAHYSRFSVGDASSHYKLSVSGYSGTAGDSLSYHSGNKFSTWEKDNDVSSTMNCAEKFFGAWWYGGCLASNLNGRYERGVTTSRATSNCWNTFKGYFYGLKITVMKIKA